MPCEKTMPDRDSNKKLDPECACMVKGENQVVIIHLAMDHVLANHTQEFNNILSPEELQRWEGVDAI